MAVEAFLMLSSLQKLAAGNPGAATISTHIFGLRCSSRRGLDSLHQATRDAFMSDSVLGV